MVGVGDYVVKGGQGRERPLLPSLLYISCAGVWRYLQWAQLLLDVSQQLLMYGALSAMDVHDEMLVQNMVG